jgi:uncharacterized membrane-anchored protein YhcB (DUF1043 family)
MNTSTASSALILITVALAGAGVSYHFTLESRFSAIEQKLEQNSVALQQYQISQDTIFSSKTEVLNNLGKEVDALQASLAPLGKATHEQTDSLAEIRKQVTSLQQSQQEQQDAQKKLADYAGQVEKLKHDAQVQSIPPSVPIPAVAPASAPAPVTSTPASTATPTARAVPPKVSVNTTPLPVAPRADSAVVDLRPAEATVAASPLRALPVALPVSLSQSGR